MNKTILLAVECGPFCTERTHPKLSWIRSEIENSLTNEQFICFDRNNVKILTTSFIDEMLSELGIRFGLDAIQKYVIFNPPLESIYLKQIERGIRLRKNVNPRDL